MKDSTTTYIIIGALVLFVTGYLLFESNDIQPQGPLETNEFLEEGIIDESSDDSINEQGINNEGRESGNVNKAPLYASAMSAKSGQTMNSGFMAYSNNYTEKFPGIFTLGTYYMKNINKEGVDACIGKKESKEDNDNEKDLDYTKENFTLEKITYHNGQVFLNITSEEIPEELCARIFQRPLENSPFNAVHLIIE